MVTEEILRQEIENALYNAVNAFDIGNLRDVRAFALIASHGAIDLHRIQNNLEPIYYYQTTTE